MAEQEETVQIHIASLDKTIDFPVRSSEFCNTCKGTGTKDKKPCPTCCGSGWIKMLDCIRCNGTKQIENGLKCNICKGMGTISEAKTKDFLEARQFCEDFQKKPAKTILICLACLAALGVCSYIVSGYAFVDLRLVKTWFAYIALLVGFVAGFRILTYLHKMNVGSYLPASKKIMIASAVIALGIAAIVIPGPIAGRYHWIESEAQEAISEAVSEHEVFCQKVKVSGNDGDVYHGIATISDGEELKVNIHYRKVDETGRKIGYSIEVEPVE